MTCCMGRLWSRAGHGGHREREKKTHEKWSLGLNGRDVGWEEKPTGRLTPESVAQATRPASSGAVHGDETS